MISGNLFTRDYLALGINETDVWRSLDASRVEITKDRLRSLMVSFQNHQHPNEAETEKDLVWPVLQALGFDDMLVQQNLSTRGRKQVPDALLFADASARELALAEADQWKRYQFGKAIVEAKRWGSALDRVERKADSEAGVASTQMLQYLSRVDIQTSGRLKMGILTDGRRWRLYHQGALSVAEDFFEIDLAKALSIPGYELDLMDSLDPRFSTERVIRLFIIFFGKAAFLQAGHSLTFHDLSRDIGKTWEERVAKDLSKVVFKQLFPDLVEALAKHDPARPTEFTEDYLELIRHSALVLLYRLLFVVYAEDRDLLPRQHEGYKTYSLTQVRLDIADRKARSQVFSDRIATYWPKLTAVFSAIATGDDALGLPPYNGGLFAKDASPLLARVELPDAVISALVFGLSHQMTDDGPRYINFRDLSVQQLGSIYERILEYGLRTDAGRVIVDADDAARHESGSYYTPDSLVMLIIERAIGPLVEDKRLAFKEKAKALGDDARSKSQKLIELSALDPAARILDLKICDPAMGSGHFLVSVVDWLADRVLATMAEVELEADWTEGSYHSPLANEIVRARSEIVRHAGEHGWPIAGEQLEDRHIIRRMILKRCVYGVDKNPMAVELAKVALWLHTFTVGAPLSFLDHHLKCGNSLFGSWISPAMGQLVEWGSPLLIHEPMRRALGAAAGMATIERLTDADISEVHQSKALFDGIESMTAQLNGLLTIVQSISWYGTLSKLDKATLQEWMNGNFGEPTMIASGKIIVAPTKAVTLSESRRHSEAEKQKLALTKKRTFSESETAMRLSEWIPLLQNFMKERFLHWQIAFPGVWRNWENEELTGGFDAIIGNPPYVRQETIAALKPVLSREFRSYAGKADLFVYFFEQGLKLLRPGGRLSYVVTNKWMRAEYAERLRDMFAEKAWVEFIADFGHAKEFFPDADVFPSVIVVRKPLSSVSPPIETDVCVIPRDAVPQTGLSSAVSNALYRLPRAHFAKQTWTLESRAVVALLNKMQTNGIRLSEFAGRDASYGIKTGLNEAYLIDRRRRDELVASDPSLAEYIRPYLRGQDIHRWISPPADLFMILMKSSGDHKWPWADAVDEEQAEKTFKKTYPSMYAHFKKYENYTDPKTGKPKGLRLREDQGRWWWELRSCAYYNQFEMPKINIQRIAFHSRFSIDTNSHFLNDSAVILPARVEVLAGVLNQPIAWYYQFKKFPHKKDEAIAMDIVALSDFPIPDIGDNEACFVDHVNESVRATKRLTLLDATLADWLSVEFGYQSKGRIALANIDSIAFMASLKKRLPRGAKPSAADVARIKKEHTEIRQEAVIQIEILRAAELELSRLTCEGYGLSPEEVALMWSTAPLRMPNPGALDISDVEEEGD